MVPRFLIVLFIRAIFFILKEVFYYETAKETNPAGELYALFPVFRGRKPDIPAILGQNAGSQTPLAIASFLITAVALPVLGVIVVAKFDGLEKLARRVNPKFAIVFTIRSTFPSARDSVSPEQPPFPLKWQ